MVITSFLLAKLFYVYKIYILNVVLSKNFQKLLFAGVFLSSNFDFKITNSLFFQKSECFNFTIFWNRYCSSIYSNTFHTIIFNNLHDFLIQSEHGHSSSTFFALHSNYRFLQGFLTNNVAIYKSVKKWYESSLFQIITIFIYR